MTTEFHLDYETRSEIALDERGLDNYVRHPSTKVLMCAYAEGNNKPSLWEPHREPRVPNELRDALEDPWVVKCAWNAAFERLISRYVLGIEIPIVEWRDTMVHARYLSMPGSLAEVSKIMGLRPDEAKLSEGKALIKLFCEPHSEGGQNSLFGVTKAGFRDWSTDPEKWELFGIYCKQDVVSERVIENKMVRFPFPPQEQANWVLDQIINERGMPAFLPLVNGARFIADKEMEHQRGLLRELTQLENPNSADQLLPWLRERGYVFSSLGKEFVKRALAGEGELTDECRRALEIRTITAKSSVNKFTALQSNISSDGRLRHQFAFGGASRTLRWCLAEGTKVTVMRSSGIVEECPIEHVTLEDKLWDGVEWVTHEGVVFSGEKETVTWDGLTASPDHIVWTSEHQKMSLREAEDRKKLLWRGNHKFLIYRITSPSGKSYIGLTGQTLSLRWSGHKKRARKGVNHPFCCAIRKYGEDAFTLEILDFACTLEQAKALEVQHISRHPKHLLYNLSKGGEYDGPEGSKRFWSRLTRDPKALDDYCSLLSSIQKSRGESAYAHLTEAGDLWRKNNPREAYYLARRGCRIANRGIDKSPTEPLCLKRRLFRKYKHKIGYSNIEIYRKNDPRKAYYDSYRAQRLARPKEQSPPVDDRPLIVRLRWKHNRSAQTRLHALHTWQNRSPDEVAEIGKKISKAQKENWSQIEDPEERSRKTEAARNSIDRTVQGPAASRGLKRFWEEIKKDPVRYKEYLDARSTTLRKSRSKR